MNFDSLVRWVLVVILVLFLGLADSNHSLALQTDQISLSEDESRQIQAAERFLSVLEKNPQFGTAFEKVYGHHVEFGTLDVFLQSLKDRVAANAKDDVAWMLLGMFEYQRGADPNAIDALRQVILLRPEAVLPQYYLGQALLRTGLSAEAIEAYEKAIANQPTRSELLEISLQLGRVHQRAQRTEDALKVWMRLESAFPDDPRVLEQIAMTLVEEENYSHALPRLERLASIVKDDYKRVLYRVQAASIKIKMDRRNEGIADLETVLSDLSPTSWLSRDVRRRIEEVFLKTIDQASLVSYYENWLASHPDDIEAMSRLARVLASSARMPEAMEWMEKAIRRAPGRTDLRREYIEQLIDSKRIQDALQQYSVLCDAAPENSDILRDWGKLVLRDTSREPADRRKEAVGIWNRMVAIRPNDASNLAMVADYFRQNQFSEEATALYRKAIELAPNDPQYREYLGEHLFNLKRVDEAIETWEALAEGPRRSAESLLRLAEVFRSFGFLDRAINEIAAACRLDTRDYGLQIRSAEFHHQANRYDEALTFLDASERLAANDDERESTLKLRIEILQSSDRLEAEIERLSATLGKEPAASPNAWHRLARYHEANRDWNAALSAIEQALKVDPKSILLSTTAARISEAAGEYEKAIASYRKLATNDRRSLGEHLMSIARLESQLGRSEEAIKVARELIVSAPGNTEHYEFYAQMCFRAGNQEDGLAALRKALRINPNEPHLILALGAALSEQLKVDEAIELYWRAFDKTEELDDKTSLIGKLVPLHQQIDQLDKLLERLQNGQLVDATRREATVCLAQAHFAIGDYPSARIELEKLLDEDSRDTNLLRQLAKLCDASGDLEVAVQYQRQLVAIAPGAETELPLANMLYAQGDIGEANEIVVRLTRLEEDAGQVLKTIDKLLTNANFSAAIAILEPLIVQSRDDWELTYRAGVAHASSSNQGQAKAIFQHLLSMRVPHDALSAAASGKQPQSKKPIGGAQGTLKTITNRQSPYDLLAKTPQVQQAVGMNQEPRTPSIQRSNAIWMPEAFGLARMASFAWLMKLSHEELNVATEPALDADDLNVHRDAIYDWLYVKSLQSKNQEIFEMASRLVKKGGIDERRFFLNAIRTRALSGEASSTPQENRAVRKSTPLNADEIECMVKCFDEVVQTKKLSDFTSTVSRQVLYSTSGMPQISIGGSWQPLTGADLSADNLLHTVVRELELAGQSKRSEELLASFLGQASSTAELDAAMSFYFDAKRREDLLAAFERWVSMAKKELKADMTGSSSRGSANAKSVVGRAIGTLDSITLRWMGQLGAEKEHATLLSVFDSLLDLALLDAKLRRQSRTTRSTASGVASTTTVASRNTIVLYHGNSVVTARMEFPPANEYESAFALRLLRQAYESSYRNGQLDELSEHLRERLSKAADEDRWIEQLFLATAIWWRNEPREALDMMAEASEKLADDVSLRLAIASKYETLGELDEAMSIIHSIEAGNPSQWKQRELLALRVAEQLGDQERAVEAATRLSGMRLDLKTQLELSNSMLRLGMHDLAKSLRSRLERRSGADAATLASLLTSYQEQGKLEEAKKVAIAILQRTPRSKTSTTASVMVSPSSSSASTNGRTQALRFLDQCGELDRLIQQAETRLLASPGSVRLCEELIEYYEVAGQRNKISGVIEKAVLANPGSVPLRLLAVNYYTSLGSSQSSNSKAACSHYLAIIKVQPNAIGQNFSRMIALFRTAGRTGELVEALQDVNFQSFQSPYQIAELLADPRRNSEHLEQAINLFEKVFNAFPQYRTMMITRLTATDLWRNDRVYAIGERAFIPTPSQAFSQPWYGLTDFIYTDASGSSVTSSFEQITQRLLSNLRSLEFQNSIEERIQEAPHWLAGKAMLVIMDIRQSRDNHAAEKLMSLFSDDSLIDSMPPSTAWVIGQEARQFKESQPLALKLLEYSLAKSSGRELKNTPLSQLIEVYKSLGREAEVRDLLFKHLPVYSNLQKGVPAANYYLFENQFWVAQKLVDHGMPIEAIRLYRELLSDPKELEAAGSYRSNNFNFFVSKANQGLKEANRKVAMMNPTEAFQQLLDPREPREPGKAVLELKIAKPSFSIDATKPLESELLGLLELFIKFENVATAAIAEASAKLLDERLVALQAKYPDDLSIRIVIAVTQLQKKNEQAIEAVKQLMDLVEKRPLPSLNDQQPPKASQVEEAALSIPLWLVARECLKREELSAEGKRLAYRALDAARLQPEPNFAFGILFEWTQLPSSRVDRENEDRLHKLLEVVSARPRRIATAALPGKTSQPIPPLTLEQLKMVVYVAALAADKGMVTLSEKAFRESLVGGMPIAEPVVPARPSVPRIVTSSSGVRTVQPSSSPAIADPVEFQVVRLLRNVLGMWKKDGYPPEFVYRLLKEFVLPPNIPTEISMHLDSWYLLDSEASSLALSLVEWAQKADKLAELEAAIDERLLAGASKSTANSMLAMIATTDEKFDRAKKLLEDLASTNSKEMSYVHLQQAVHAAIPALDHPALLEPAYLIVERFIHQQEMARRANSANILPNGKTLQRRLDNYRSK